MALLPHDFPHGNTVAGCSTDTPRVAAGGLFAQLNGLLGPLFVALSSACWMGAGNGWWVAGLADDMVWSVLWASRKAVRSTVKPVSRLI